jgi:hypothetical protein
MNAIGVLPAEQMRELWQWYQSQKQLPAQLTKNFPQRRPIDEPSPHRAFIYNTGSEIIPAFACVRVVGTREINNITAIDVEKPTSTDGEFLLNGPYPIAVPSSTEPGVGWAYRHGVVTMLGDEPTEPGASYGPIVGSWEIEEGGDKFVVFGRHDFSDRALVGRFNGGGTISQWGLVNAKLGCGWYTIELGTLDDSEEASGSGPVCDPCVGVTGEGTVDCGLALEYPTARVTGTGVFVTAYDPASTIISLRLGSDCVVTKMQGGSTTSSGSGSGASGTLWSVRGLQDHIVQFKERWECCPDGTPRLVGKTPIVFAGRACEEIICDECPSSGSGS